MADDRMIKHLELIQAVVARLSAHSFRLKTLALVKVAAVLLAFSSEEDAALLLLAPVAAALLWVLDAWFLREERAYRKHYDKVRLLPDRDVDFSMDVSEHHVSILSTVFSATLFWFYLLLVVSSTVAALYLG